MTRRLKDKYSNDVVKALMEEFKYTNPPGPSDREGRREHGPRRGRAEPQDHRVRRPPNSPRSPAASRS
jgi:hypothetical protein